MGGKDIADYDALTYFHTVLSSLSSRLAMVDVANRACPE
jgi:hypothetical protein